MKPNPITLSGLEPLVVTPDSNFVNVRENQCDRVQTFSELD